MSTRFHGYIFSLYPFLKIILLVYNSYVGGFIVTFLFIHMLYPELLHPLHIHPSLFSIPLLKITKPCFNSLNSYRYTKCNNHTDPHFPSTYH
jgi:hypothetical protein